MNMFRHIATVAFMALGISLYIVPQDQWQWVSAFGAQTVFALNFLFSAEPFSSIICVVIATALFMTRKQY